MYAFFINFSGACCISPDILRSPESLICGFSFQRIHALDSIELIYVIVGEEVFLKLFSNQFSCIVVLSHN